MYGFSSTKRQGCLFTLFVYSLFDIVMDMWYFHIVYLVLWKIWCNNFSHYIHDLVYIFYTGKVFMIYNFQCCFRASIIWIEMCVLPISVMLNWLVQYFKCLQILILIVMSLSVVVVEPEDALINIQLSNRKKDTFLNENILKISTFHF